LRQPTASPMGGKLDAKEAVTNDLIDEINKFDATEITAMAKAYKGKWPYITPCVAHHRREARS